MNGYEGGPANEKTVWDFFGACIAVRFAAGAAEFKQPLSSTSRKRTRDRSDEHQSCIDTGRRQVRPTPRSSSRMGRTQDGPIIHLDSAAVIDGKNLCAHSNGRMPMTSSIEGGTPQPGARGQPQHRLHWGPPLGDRHDGYWWVAFANYDRPYGPNKTPTGKICSTIVKAPTTGSGSKAWTLPNAILERQEIEQLGGSWRPTDSSTVGPRPCGNYKCVFPKCVPYRAGGNTAEEHPRQGIAWDRSETGVLYAQQGHQG